MNTPDFDSEKGVILQVLGSIPCYKTYSQHYFMGAERDRYFYTL